MVFRKEGLHSVQVCGIKYPYLTEFKRPRGGTTLQFRVNRYKPVERSILIMTKAVDYSKLCLQLIRIRYLNMFKLIKRYCFLTLKLCRANVNIYLLTLLSSFLTIFNQWNQICLSPSRRISLNASLETYGKHSSSRSQNSADFSHWLIIRQTKEKSSCNPVFTHSM